MEHVKGPDNNDDGLYAAAMMQTAEDLLGMIIDVMLARDGNAESPAINALLDAKRIIHNFAL